MPVGRGVDISSYQRVGSWRKLRDAVDFVIVKATEGNSFTSNTWRRYWRDSRQNGILTGSYHFARPPGDARNEARHYVSALREAGFRPGHDLPPVLDIERTGGLEYSTLTRWCQAFLDEVDSQLGLKDPWLRCGFYSNLNYYQNQLNGNQLHKGRWWWAAAWPNQNGPWPDSVNYDGAAIWQWTSKSSIPGIGGNVDANVSRDGSLSNLAPKYFGGVKPEPKPPEDDMPTPEDLYHHKLTAGSYSQRVGKLEEEEKAGTLIVSSAANSRYAVDLLRGLKNEVGALQSTVDTLANAVAKQNGINPEELLREIRTAIKEATVDVDVSVSGGSSSTSTSSRATKKTTKSSYDKPSSDKTSQSEGESQ